MSSIRRPQDRSRRAFRRSTTGDVAAAIHDIDGALAFAASRWSDAARSWIANAEASDLNAPYALPKAGLAAVLAGDASMAQDVLDRLAAIGARGRALETDMAGIRAGMTAIAGDPGAALAAYRSTRAVFRELGLSWDEALCGMAAGLRLGLADAEVRGWVGAAAATFGQLRARPFVEMAERLLEGAPTVRSESPESISAPA